MKPFKAPDLSAPRYRPKKLNLLNNEFCERFREKYPKYKHLSNQQIKEVVKAVNGAMWQEVISSRDGIELPEQLGFIFIGTCPRKHGENTDYKKSRVYGVKTQNKNWESDQYVAKIFYTNFETKYHFRFHELWGFTAVRDFKRTVASTYPEQWKQYVMVDNLVKVSRIFRKQVYKEHIQKETLLRLEDYDEFDLS
jgi:hypothetical protein